MRRLPVVLCCAAVFVAGACTPGVRESNVDPKTVVVFLPSDNAGDIQLRQAQADAFMKEHPDIPVDVTVIPVEAYDQKITTSVGGGATVDIFNTGEVILPSLLDRGFTLDLNQFVDKETYSEKGFYPQVIDGLTVQGHLMGLADNWDTQVMYYNRDLFDKAGLDYPDGTWDWSEFVAVARQLTAGEGTKKVYGAVHEAWFAPLWDRIWSEGGQVFNQDGTRCMLDDPNSVRAIQSLADLYSQGISPSQPQMDQGALDPLQLFLAGRSAMWIGSGRWAAFDLKDAQNLNWAIAPIPNGTDHPRANFFHLSLYSIAARSDSPDNAWEFLKFMVSPEGIDLGLQNMQGIPSREKIANASGFRNDPFVKDHDAYQPFIESLKTVHTAPYLVRFDEAENAMSAGLSPVWRGERTAEQVAQGICDEVDRVLSADE